MQNMQVIILIKCTDLVLDLEINKYKKNLKNVPQNRLKV